MLQLFSRQWDNNLRKRSLHTSCICTDNVCISNCSHLRTLSLLFKTCYSQAVLLESVSLFQSYRYTGPKVNQHLLPKNTPAAVLRGAIFEFRFTQILNTAVTLNLLLATWLLAQFCSQALIWIILSPYKSKSLAIILILMINATELTFDDQKLWCTMKCM